MKEFDTFGSVELSLALTVFAGSASITKLSSLAVIRSWAVVAKTTMFPYLQ
jgi:hypothetical protein